jgi:hypothetical protein
MLNVNLYIRGDKKEVDIIEVKRGVLDNWRFDCIGESNK